MTAIVVAEAAQAQIDEVAAWWLEHRPAAPDLFEKELEAALAVLTTAPRAGSP